MSKVAIGHCLEY